jgi:hypothetical protein
MIKKFAQEKKRLKEKREEARQTNRRSKLDEHCIAGPMARETD